MSCWTWGLSPPLSLPVLHSLKVSLGMEQAGYVTNLHRLTQLQQLILVDAMPSDCAAAHISEASEAGGARTTGERTQVTCTEVLQRSGAVLQSLFIAEPYLNWGAPVFNAPRFLSVNPALQQLQRLELGVCGDEQLLKCSFSFPELRHMTVNLRQDVVLQLPWDFVDCPKLQYNGCCAWAMVGGVDLDLR